jgi:hypothetical protein
MQPSHRLGKIEHDLGHVGPALEVAAPLQLEQVSLCSENDILLEALTYSPHLVLLTPVEQPKAGSG